MIKPSPHIKEKAIINANNPVASAKKSIALENNWLLKEGFATPNINAAKTSPIAPAIKLVAISSNYFGRFNFFFLVYFFFLFLNI